MELIDDRIANDGDDLVENLVKRIKKDKQKYVIKLLCIMIHK